MRTVRVRRAGQGGSTPPNPSGTQPGKGAASTPRRPALRRENTPKPPRPVDVSPQNQHKGQNKARYSFFMPQTGKYVRVQNKNAAERLKMPFSAAGKNKRRRPSPAAPCRTKKKGRSPKAAPSYHFMQLKIIAIGKIAIKNKIYSSIIKNHSFAPLY